MLFIKDEETKANMEEYLKRRGALQYQYAKPYMHNMFDPSNATERELKREIKEGFEYLPPDEIANYKQDLASIYKDVFGVEHPQISNE